MNEIFLMPIVVYLAFTGKGIFLPIIYYRFLLLRYSSERNPYKYVHIFSCCKISRVITHWHLVACVSNSWTLPPCNSASALAARPLCATSSSRDRKWSSVWRRNHKRKRNEWHRGIHNLHAELGINKKREFGISLFFRRLNFDCTSSANRTLRRILYGKYL